MKSSKLVKLVSLPLLVLFTLGAQAEDIDLYSSNTSNGPNPNIIILVDSAAVNDSAYSSSCPYTNVAGLSATGTKLFDMVQCALYTAIDQIGQQPTLLNKLNIGLMGFGTGSNKGGLWWVPAPYPSSLPAMDATGIANAKSLIAANITKSNNSAAASSFQEAWAFFTGGTGLSGHSYSDHINQTCQKGFIIYIGAAQKNGKPSSGDSGVTDLAAAGASAAQQIEIKLNGTPNFGSSTKFQDSWMDEWARFLNQSDLSAPLNGSQNIVTYTIAAGDGSSDPDYSEVLASTAYYGGGKAFVATDVNSMVQALLKIFNEVQSVNSVFASPGLPVSANAQGTYLNQIFIGMFRPDANSSPRWRGNLKQYQIGVSTTGGAISEFLADSQGSAAISSSGTGFFSPNAISFWTSKTIATLPDSIGGFWINDTQAKQGISGGYDREDGEIVEKGGVAQQIRLANLTDNYSTNTTGPRTVYTDIGASSGTPGQFATTNSGITTTLLNITGPSSTVSSISRSGTTVTVTLSSAPATALTNGQNVTIAGSAYSELNGNFTIALVNSTKFTYTISEDPPSPSTGTYTASIPSSPKSITTLARSGSLVTAYVSGGHGYFTGQSVTVTGATQTEYNGTFAVTVTDSTHFTYTITDSPGTATVGGTANIGTTNTDSITFTAPQITRNTTASDGSSIVTVTISSNLPTTYVTGAKVNVSGVTPAGYNVTLANILYGGGNSQGSSCPGVSSSNKKQAFCYTIQTTPANTATGSPMADSTATSTISSLTHSVACTVSSPTATTTVTATTSTAHPFTTGETVSIGGTTGAGESAYVGSFSVTKLSSTTFSYSVTTTPPCSPSATGVTAITNTGGIDRDSLIRWVRGEDNIGDESSPGSGITIRPSVHGDVVHSRPAVINYAGSTGVVVFYGDNAGTFHAINGNQPPKANVAPNPLGNCTVSTDCKIGGVAPGGELWSFVPSEFYSKLGRLYLNSPGIKIASTPTGITPTPQPKDYFFDGTTSVYQNGSAAYIYLSARRGGRLIYAIDVSNPTTPKLLWKRSNSDSGFSELGQTWSQPKVARVRGNANPVLIFGGGYDTNEDSEPATADTMGRGIFIVDAVTGNLLWSAGPSGGTTNVKCSGNPCVINMSYAIPADITLVDRNFDGYADRLYASDTGGNIWRVDLEPTSSTDGPSKWQVTKFASLGGAGTTKRKFFYPPDVVVTKNFDAVLAGTGDREHPLLSQAAYSIVNRFYMIKDTLVGMDGSAWSAVVDDSSSTANAAPSAAALFDATSTPYPSSLVSSTSSNGFYVTLTNSGEKVVNAPTTVGNFTYFGTNKPIVPSTTTCDVNLGQARGYKLNWLTGKTTSGLYDGGGLPPSPVFGVVDTTVNGQDMQLPFLFGGPPTPDCKSADCVQKPPIPINPTKKRTYWYREIDR